MKKSIFYIFMLIMVFSLEAKPSLNIDYAQFQAGEDWEYIELYFSFDRNQLKYYQNEDHYETQYEFHVQVIQNDSILVHQTWKRLDRVNQLSEIKGGQIVYDQASFFLKPGSILIASSILNQDQDTLFFKQISVDVYKMNKTQLNMSDIELAVQVKSDTSKNIFNKNNYSVIPNASRLYGMQLKKVYYYCEIYQLSSYSDNIDSTYIVTIGVFNQNQMLVKTLPKRIRLRHSKSLVEFGEIDISDLPSGEYFLKIIVKDNATQSDIFKTKKFTIYNKPVMSSRIIHEGNLIRIKSKK